MFPFSARPSWSFGFGANMAVDFCLWTLECDGLRVAPFDRHPDGDGSLRAAGLDGASWQAWLVRVVALQEEQAEALRQLPPTSPAQRRADVRAALMPEAHQPALAWQSNPAVGMRLAELWNQQYGPIGNDRTRGESQIARELHREEVRTGARLYDALRPYHRRLATLKVHLAPYMVPITYLVPPVSVVMTGTMRLPDAAELRERILDAAAGLSATTLARRQTIHYVAAPFSNPGQPALAYKVFPPRPAPPVTTPAPNPMPPTENEAQRRVLEALSRPDGAYGTVNLASVRFVRSKAIPGWQLYHVTFDETSGEQQRLAVMLHQMADGSWMVRSASTGGDARETAARWLPPIHDHPLIFLGGGKSADANGVCEFTAHGEIVDNGFDVERVRLSNDAGDVFEDIVEDGLVLFATVQDHEVAWPMTAELYDRTGKLVWRQRVFDMPAHRP